MRPILIALALLTTAVATAQTPTPPLPPTHAVVTTETFRFERTLGCPVGFSASKQGSPAAIWTNSLEDSRRSADELKALHSGSGVHVDLNARHKVIKQADIQVFFMPSATRVLPVAGNQYLPAMSPDSEDSKNFSLVGESSSHRLDGDLLLGPIASIKHVSLMHVIYTDGTEWKARDSASCSRKPSLYMPVDAK